MSLQGSLPDFTVVDVLHLLAFGGKTGVVRFAGGRTTITQAGAIYFREGAPVAAETDEQLGTAALDLLCAWSSGSFVFQEGSPLALENLEQPQPKLVERARAAIEEWRQIWTVLPMPSATVRLATQLPERKAEVRLGREEWKLLAGMGGPATLSDLAQQVGGGLPAYRVLRGMADEGLFSMRGRE